MATVDVYRITDELDDPTLDAVAVRLEARGKHPRFVEMMHEYLAAMESTPQRACSIWAAGRASRRERLRGDTGLAGA